MILVWFRFQLMQGLGLHWVVLMKHGARWLFSAWHLPGCTISSMFCLTQVFSGWTDHSKWCLFFFFWRGGNTKKGNRVRSKCYTSLNSQPYLIHDSFNHNRSLWTQCLLCFWPQVEYTWQKSRGRAWRLRYYIISG